MSLAAGCEENTAEHLQPFLSHPPEFGPFCCVCALLSFPLLAPGPRSLLLQACLHLSSLSPLFYTVLHIQDEFSSSRSNTFPPASFFACFYPILLPFPCIFSSPFSPVLPHVSVFSSIRLAYPFCLASSPHISVFSTPPFAPPGSLAGVFSSPRGLAGEQLGVHGQPQIAPAPLSKLPVPTFFQCHFSCPHLGWMEKKKKTVTMELCFSTAVLVCFVAASGKYMHI